MRRRDVLEPGARLAGRAVLAAGALVLLNADAHEAAAAAVAAVATDVRGGGGERGGGHDLGVVGALADVLDGQGGVLGRVGRGQDVQEGNGSGRGGLKARRGRRC